MYNSYDSYNSGMAAGAIMAIVLVAVIIGLIPVIFYLINLQNTLKAVRPQNQKMPPGQVWLMFIPIFNIIWNFIMVQRIAESIKAEYDSRQLPCKEEKPAYSIGLAMCICNCCGWIPILGALAGLGGLVLWIVYWIKTAEYKRDLQSLQASSPM